MGESSLALIEAKKYHSAVYLGGYTLEGYLKSILLKELGYDLEELKLHLNQKKRERFSKNNEVFLHKEVESFLKLKSNIISNSILLSSNKNYPKFLINGGSNKIKQKKWDVEERYKIEQWSEAEYALKIKVEVENIMNEIIDKYLTEGGIK